MDDVLLLNVEQVRYARYSRNYKAIEIARMHLYFYNLKNDVLPRYTVPLDAINPQWRDYQRAQIE